MYNSASTLVARDLAARFKPDMPQRRQIFIGQIALLIVMVGGIMTTPLIGRYTHIWEYLQEVTAYFSVPFAVVGIGGIFIKRVNRSGAFAAIITGVIVSAVLMADSHSSGGLLDVLRHPYLNSFLHRSFLCAVISFIPFILVSIVTQPPSAEIKAGVLHFSWAKGEGETDRDFAIAKRWMLTLFLIVIILLWIFR
jgi:Na+/proline symporter